MPKVASHIFRRGSKLHYRRRVPEDVRQLGGFGGKEHFQASLKTCDASVARATAVAMDERFDRECAMVRGVPAQRPTLTGTSAGMVLSDVYLKSFQDRYVAKALAFDHDERLRAIGNPDLQAIIDDRDDLDAPSSVVDADGQVVRSGDTEERHRRIDRETFRRVVSGEVDRLAKAFGAEGGSPEFTRIEEMFIEAEARVYSGVRERQTGSFGHSYRPSDNVGLAIKPESSWTLQKLASRYQEVRPGGASWRHKVNVAVTLFEGYLGRPMPISEITADHVREFLELLARSPQRASMRFPGMGLREASAANKSRLPKPHPLISPNTIRDNHLAVLRVLFGYACGDISAIAIDPTARRKVYGTTKKAGRASLFQIDELQALFALPHFAGCRSSQRTQTPGDVKLVDHRFWTPLIMLFSGARPSEIAQLSVTDIKLSDDFPSISILTEFDESDPEDQPWVVAFKTSNARRIIPLHPQLIALGFGDYVENMKRNGSARLFPEWKMPADARKLYSGATWVRRFNEKCIPLVTSRKPKPSLYSFRHNFKTQMAICRVQPQSQNQVMGHANPGMDPIYLHGCRSGNYMAKSRRSNIAGWTCRH